MTQPKYIANGTHFKETEEGAEIETSELLASMVWHQKPLRCLETGTAWGQTASYIGRALKAIGRGYLDTCDTEPRMAAYERVADLPVTIHQKRGIDLINEQEPGLNFVFIDSWWTDVRIEEALAVIPKMAPGGLLCLHDISANYGGVYHAVKDATGWPSICFHAPYGLAVFQAPGHEHRIGAGLPVELAELSPMGDTPSESKVNTIDSSQRP